MGRWAPPQQVHERAGSGGGSATCDQRSNKTHSCTWEYFSQCSVQSPVMNSESILNQVRVASPCNARWEDMTGDDRTRFCQHCQKHVFNLTAMSGPEAEQLVREKEGKFCGRFFQRRDGRMLTGNCPVGQHRRRSRLVKFCAAGFAAIAIFCTAFAAGGSQRRNGQRGPLAQKIDVWIYDAKVKLGIIKPPVFMGKLIMVPPPPANPSASNSGK